MFVDKDYLINQQYASQKNLQQRIAIHQFSTNTKAFWPWVLSHYAILPGSKILEVGCGNGCFWQETKNFIPLDCQILLTDLSAGMLQDAKRKLVGLPQVHFSVMDVEQLPLASHSYDWVLAHFMLYHAHNKQTALQEIKRVLKPEGSLGILLPSKNTFKELFALLSCEDTRQFHAFSAETAMQELPKHFANMNYFIHQDELAIPQVDPVIDYLKSLPTMEKKSADFYQRAKDKIKTVIDREGFLKLTVIQYIFVVKRK